MATATPRRHIFFAADSQDPEDKEAVEALKNELRSHNLRYYRPRKDDDVNASIGRGIEGAAIVLVFPSPALQHSKTGAKVINYADQSKTTMLRVSHRSGFQPTEWLGAILSRVPSVPLVLDEILKALSSLQV